MFQTKVVEEFKTHFVFSKFFENRTVYEIMWKNIIERSKPQMTMQRMHIHAGYKHTLRICNTYCSSATTIVSRTRLNVTLYVHCLLVYFIIVRLLAGGGYFTASEDSNLTLGRT